MGEPRNYRRLVRGPRFASFVVARGESDLWIAVDPESYRPSLPEEVGSLVAELRAELFDYIAHRPLFGDSFEPIPMELSAPPIARSMLRAASIAGVGPMAAVAGAIAGAVCEALVGRLGCEEAVVENGGDDAIQTKAPCSVLLIAGASPFSGRVAFEVGGAEIPRAVATSAGKVGHSYSVGRADACMALAADAATADAYATAFANRLGSEADVEAVLALASKSPGLLGLAVAVGEKLGCVGELRPHPLAPAGGSTLPSECAGGRRAS